MTSLWKPSIYFLCRRWGFVSSHMRVPRKIQSNDFLADAWWHCIQRRDLWSAHEVWYMRYWPGEVKNDTWILPATFILVNKGSNYSHWIWSYLSFCCHAQSGHVQLTTLTKLVLCRFILHRPENTKKIWKLPTRIRKTYQGEFRQILLIIYPGCQRLYMHKFPISVTARDFGLRPKICRAAALESRLGQAANVRFKLSIYQNRK